MRSTLRFQLKNSSLRYGIVTIALHWIMAVIITSLLALGLYMSDLPNGLEKLKLYGWHKEWGILVLMLATVRFCWRLMNEVPLLLLPSWEKLTAHAVHWAFYGFMFAMPITGWLMSSAAGFPVSFFGLFVLPDVILPDKQLMKLLEETHEWLGYGLMALITLHVLAALKHHYINKDDILKRMLS